MVTSYNKIIFDMIWMPDGIYSTNLNKLNLPYHFDQTITKHSFYILCLISSCVCLYISHYIVLVIQILLHANQHLFYIYKGLWTHYIRPHTHTLLPPPPPTFETPKILDLEIVTIFNVIVITHWWAVLSKLYILNLNITQFLNMNVTM